MGMENNSDLISIHNDPRWGAAVKVARQRIRGGSKAPLSEQVRRLRQVISKAQVPPHFSSVLSSFTRRFRFHI
jgi:hypothetical protein